MTGHILPLSLRFLWVFLAATIGVALLTGLIGLGNAGTSLIPFWAAAMDIGTRFHHRTGQRPTSGEAWQLAGLCTLVACLISAPFVYLVLAADPGGAFSPGLLLGVAAGLAGVMFLLARVFVWLGGRNAAKVAEKKAQKEARDAVAHF